MKTATGGGPPPQEPSTSTQVVIGILGDSIEPLYNPQDPPSPIANVEDRDSTLFESGEPQELSQDGVLFTATGKQNGTRLTSQREKRYRYAEKKEMKMKIMNEALEAEKARKEAEQIRAENERLKKWMLVQECIEKGYDLPSEDFE